MIDVVKNIKLSKNRQTVAPLLVDFSNPEEYFGHMAWYISARVNPGETLEKFIRCISNWRNHSIYLSLVKYCTNQFKVYASHVNITGQNMLEFNLLTPNTNETYIMRWPCIVFVYWRHVFQCIFAKIENYHRYIKQLAIVSRHFICK